ncbi:unnamed protein product [Mytilus coruscus]|uniref:Uncharacterized protein n=1 Tax=Mytilus coruscus TaxID=42192 RepID=A0A6J8DKJ1_MYTCO|nr:unnamed protein product [Mytilus coruscus]
MYGRQRSYFPTGVIFITLGWFYVSSGKSTDMKEHITYQTEERSCYLEEYSYNVYERKGMTTSPDVYLRSEVYSKDKEYVIKLTCYAFLQPFAGSVSFLLNSFQIDGIRNNGNKCFHKDGPCLPEKCSCCSKEDFYAFVLIFTKSDIKDFRSLSCEMRNNNNNAKRIASIDLDYTDFIATESKPSIKESYSKISRPRTPENKDQDKMKDTIDEDKTFNKDRSGLSAIPGVCFVILLLVVLLWFQRRTQRSIFITGSKLLK